MENDVEVYILVSKRDTGQEFRPGVLPANTYSFYVTTGDLDYKPNKELLRKAFKDSSVWGSESGAIDEAMDIIHKYPNARESAVCFLEQFKEQTFDDLIKD